MSTNSPPLPPWPDTPPRHGRVLLRAVTEQDVTMARDLSTDPYVPATGSLPARATPSQARAWVRRQQRRHAEGSGFSFTIAVAATGRAVGHCGLWLREFGAGRASAGYALAPFARGQGLAVDALTALTHFAWTVPGLFRIALYIEPDNHASIRTAEAAGYLREGLLHSHQEIAGRRRDMVLYAVVRPSGTATDAPVA
ncbi:GNAT family N-acetyltransferase [Pseudactinotalea sp. Z1732]|uniref:GNAT family N-acetyltransferase n=1 Tax=Micrococcales TaxID=85006 RepID=UPI003C7BC6E3